MPPNRPRSGARSRSCHFLGDLAGVISGDPDSVGAQAPEVDQPLSVSGLASIGIAGQATVIDMRRRASDHVVHQLDSNRIRRLRARAGSSGDEPRLRQRHMLDLPEGEDVIEIPADVMAHLLAPLT